MKRVFIYSSHSLFSQGIKNLLDAEPQFDVIGWETDPEEAIKRIQEVRPDAILIVTRGSSTGLLSDGQRFLREGGRTLIVELNLEDNNVCVYRGEHLAIQGVGDLVRAIAEPLSSFGDASV